MCVPTWVHVHLMETGVFSGQEDHRPLEQSTLSATKPRLQLHLCISYLCFILISTSLWPSRNLGLSQHLSSIFTSYFRSICWGNFIFTTRTQNVIQCEVWKLLHYKRVLTYSICSHRYFWRRSPTEKTLTGLHMPLCVSGSPSTGTS